MPVTTVTDAPDLPAAPDPRPPAAGPLPSDRVLVLADRHRRLIFALILALYAAGFNGQWRLEPDSALYLSIGRNLVEGQGYTYHGKDHRLAYPGVPLLFAGLFKAFGPGSLLPHLAAMWLMGLATLALTYRLFLLHAGRPTAVLVTLGVALSRVFYRYSFELLSDLPFLLGVTAFLVGYEAIFYRRGGGPAEEARAAAGARWYDGVLLLAGLGLAVAARPAMWALVAAAGLALAWSVVRGRARWGHVAVAAMVVAAVALFYLKDPRHQRSDPAAPAGTSYVEEDQLFQVGTEKLAHYYETARGNVPGVFENAVAKAGFGTSVLPGLNTVLAVALVAGGLALVRTRPLWGMWVLATLAMVMLVPRPVDRYFLPVLPVLVYGWWTLTRAAERRAAVGGRRAATLAFLLLFGLGAVPNVVSLLGFVYEQRYRPFLAYYKKGRYASADDVARLIERRTPPSGDPRDPRTTWVAVPEKFARAMTFLGRRYCFEPDVGTPVDPLRQSTFVLEPTEPIAPDPAADPRRVPVPQWLADKGVTLVPTPVGGPVPNRDPDDPRPWTLHKVVPLGPPATTQTEPHAGGAGVSRAGAPATQPAP